jgi:hypothetical protein
LTLTPEKREIRLETGWVENPGLLLIRNEPIRDQLPPPLVKPIPDDAELKDFISQADIEAARKQMEEISKSIVENKNIILDISVDGIKFGEIPAHHSLRLVPRPGATYSISLRAGKAKITILAFPRKVEEPEEEDSARSVSAF